jgi:hypothetical protein
MRDEEKGSKKVEGLLVGIVFEGGWRGIDHWTMVLPQTEDISKCRRVE